MSERYYDPKDLMEVLKIGRTTSYQLFNREDFPKTRIGRKMLVSESALARWMANGGTQQQQNGGD